MVNLAHALFKGRIAVDNPWILPGLEWRTTSPPPKFNFEVTPTVTWEAYDFSEKNGLPKSGEERRDRKREFPLF
jgi:cytochrome c oxidase subunit I